MMMIRYYLKTYDKNIKIVSIVLPIILYYMLLILPSLSSWHPSDKSMMRSVTRAFLGSWRVIVWIELQFAEFSNTISILVFIRREFTCVDTWKEDRTTDDNDDDDDVVLLLSSTDADAPSSTATLSSSAADTPSITAEKQQHTIIKSSSINMILY